MKMKKKKKKRKKNHGVNGANWHVLNMHPYKEVFIIYWEGGWQMGKLNVSNFLYPPMIKANFSCLPQRESKNFFDSPPPPIVMMHLL